ncbi:hypothetical protein TNCV_2348771 [Trichonephila clavipes]|uniref:Uncharacterized protein n=1 Tax=Trichonephila clavipes TaxID=2585209 RepID=A0A8X6SLZ9_TRICX|nr:hypothetical protein TNCV_2348771 [Trichonephila clavipes]
MSFPWVRAVNGRIFKNSSFVEKSSNTILMDIANCAVSTASIDSSSCIEKIHRRQALLHEWYEGNHPDAALLGTSSRKDETSLARFRSGHTRA